MNLACGCVLTNLGEQLSGSCRVGHAVPRPPFRVVIVVPFDIGCLSPNRHLHHMERARLTKLARGTARLAWMQAGRPQAPGKVRVSMLVRRGRESDQQNLWSAAKAACDGIFCDALTPDDSPRWVEIGSLKQETGKRWSGNRAEVVFEIEGI